MHLQNFWPIVGFCQLGIYHSVPGHNFRCTVPSNGCVPLFLIIFPAQVVLGWISSMTCNAELHCVKPDFSFINGVIYQVALVYNIGQQYGCSSVHACLGPGSEILH